MQTQSIQKTHSNPGFTSALKDWRKVRKMSQLDLSLEAQVSQRHLSWLETGRAKPSREMVIRLADTLSIPNRDRNRLLGLAGFAPLFVESELDAPIMQMVTDVLEKMLVNHDPYPAIVMDRQWNLKMKNKSADKLFELFGDPAQILEDIGDDGQFNIARLSFHPKGLRRFASNWGEIAPSFFARLRREAIELNDPIAISLLDELAPYVDDYVAEQHYPASLSPLLPLHYSINGHDLKLVSVLSSFGSAQDVTATELRIETFYPADDATTEYFKSL